MGRLFLLLSLSICTFAVLLSLNSFASVRSQLLQNIPDAVKQLFVEIIGVLTRLVASVLKLDRLFTKEELSKYTGQTGGAIYIAILGHVYDVTRGKKHYGPGGGYDFFSGQDGSRAFVSGDFTEKGLTDDVSGFSTSEVLTLQEWDTFYKKDYSYVGKLIGNFYDAEGNPTVALNKYRETLEKALAEKKEQEDFKQIFPPCNSQWSQGGHTRVWCSNRSGGIQRDWVGVPRQYFEPGKAQARPRCVCVRNSGPPSGALHSDSHKNRGDLDNPNLKMYDGCDVHADFCMYVSRED